MRKRTALLSLVIISGCAGSAKNPSTVAPQPDTEIEKQIDAPGDPKYKEKKITTHEVESAAPQKSQEKPLSILSLCEPIGERWEYPSSVQKKEVRRTIQKTCKAMGVGNEDCKFFLDIVSIRESGYRWWVRHKLNGDVSAALSSYIGRSRTYGWNVRWGAKGRKSEDLSKLEFKPHGAEQNPYFLDPSRWMFGLGLGGLNISYHLAKFDKLAPPEILCDPTINTMIQVTIARNAVNRYGAANFAEVQAIYAGRTYYNEQGRSRPLSCTQGCPKTADERQRARARKGDASILKRCKSKGLDCYKKPNLGKNLILGNMTPNERYKAAEKIRGTPLPAFDINSEKVLNTRATKG